MQLGRRKFFGFLGATPLVAKQAAESIVKDLSRINGGGGTLPTETPPLSAPVYDHIGEAKLSENSITKAFLDPNHFKDLESILYKRERCIQTIDPDIAVYRSFSLAAKIAYQRQRNVHREVDMYMKKEGTEYWHTRMMAIARRSLIGV